MKVVVTGADGQLGTDLCQYLQAQGHEAIALTLAQLDITDAAAVQERIAAHQADWVVNCAAHTQVDRAETEQALAYAVNRDGAAALAAAVAAQGGRLAHISTDFIFDGDHSRPYQESDTANPVNVYGRSKWEGEQAVLAAMPDALIVRTAWVHGAQGNNFVTTILRLAAERERLTIVDDQIGTPSWTGDISVALLQLMEQQATGVFHFTNEGVASWYDFACAIVGEARALGRELKVQEVLPIPSSAYPTPAQRPAYSVLNKEKIRARLAGPIPHWRESLQVMLRELFA